MVGIPGSGKNMIGKILEDVSGREWVDIDTQIEAKSGMSIPEIFIEGGEPRYRELERQVIKETAKRTGLLISTGSGAVRCEENLHWLRQNGRLYYIDRDLTVSPAEKMKSSEETEAAHNRMNELEQYRKALEVYDENIFDLLVARNALIEKMMVYKEARQIPIFQPEQEQKKNDLWNAKLNEVRHSDEVLQIMNRILKSSKRIQSRKLFSFNIILIGFMGAGKSTVADFLSTLYAMKVVEMDQVIAEREQMSISDIFATYGEAYFRNLETELLIELQSKKDVVVSCGGGVAMREENVREMKKNGKVVLLTASPEVILERVKDSDERPLLNGNKNVGFIRDLIEQRRNKYEAAADITIHTDGRTVTEICEDLVERLSEL
ncbi:MAG: shikimate kinase [Lachnospiraceae bacterium]